MTEVPGALARVVRARRSAVRWRVTRWWVARCHDDRGDVPGWVLVTIMTAGLVAALWAVAGDMLTSAFSSAIQDTVGGR